MYEEVAVSYDFNAIHTIPYTLPYLYQTCKLFDCGRIRIMTAAYPEYTLHVDSCTVAAVKKAQMLAKN